MRVIVVHFGLWARERAQQVDTLLRVIDSRETPLLAIMGDVNEWRPWTRALARLSARLGQTPGPRTFPSLLPLLPLDRIWIVPGSVVEGVEAHDTKLARRASDHLPVRARLSLAWQRWARPDADADDAADPQP